MPPAVESLLKSTSSESPLEKLPAPGRGTAPDGLLRRPEGELAPGSGTEPLRTPEADEPGRGTEPLRRPEGDEAPGNGIDPPPLRIPDGDDAPGNGIEPPLARGAAPGSGTAGMAPVGPALKSRSTPGSDGGGSPTRVASSFHEVAAGFAALMPGSGTAAMPDFVAGLGAGTFDGGAAARLAPGIAAAAPGRGTAPGEIARVGSVSQSEGPVAPLGNGAPSGTARVGSSSQLVAAGLGAEMPGSGTAPLGDDEGARAPPGNGTAPVGAEAAAAPPGSGTAPVLAPGFTGKTF